MRLFSCKTRHSFQSLVENKSETSSCTPGVASTTFFSTGSLPHSVFRKKSADLKSHFPDLFSPSSPWRAQCLLFTANCSNGRQTKQFCFVFFHFVHHNSTPWMPHKYQIMTNLIFTIPPPYADEGIIAILAQRKGYRDAMTLTSKADINFGMQSSWFTQHYALLSQFKVFLLLASMTDLYFAGLRIKHPEDTKTDEHLQNAFFVEVNCCETYSEPWAETVLSSSEQSSPAALLPAAAFIPPYTVVKEMGARGVFKSMYYYTTLASLSHAWMRQVTDKKKKKTTVIKWVINNCIRTHKMIRLRLGKQPKKSGEFEFAILVFLFQRFLFSFLIFKTGNSKSGDPMTWHHTNTHTDHQQS